jgi:transposase
MSTKQEKEMIEELGVVAEKAGFVDISKIKEKFEKLSGQSVHKTTIYRFLERHGFRKIAPRKYHPKQNKETQEAFKKTSLT